MVFLNVLINALYRRARIICRCTFLLPQIFLGLIRRQMRLIKNAVFIDSHLKDSMTAAEYFITDSTLSIRCIYLE